VVADCRAGLGPCSGGPRLSRMLEPTPTASLPLEPHEGIAAVAVADAREGAQLVTDSIRAAIIRVAMPAVASSLLMTLFSSVDAFWGGTRIGAVRPRAR